MVFTQLPEPAPWDGESVYRRIRLVAVAIPAVFVFLLLLTVLILDRELSRLSALVIGGGFAIAGVIIFSSQVFAALEPLRRRLLDQNEELRLTSARLRAVYEAGVNITSDLSLDVVLKEVVDASRQVVGATYGAVAVVNEEGKIVDFIASGVTDEQHQKIGGIPKGRGLIGHVIRTGRPYRTGDMAFDPNATAMPEGHPPMTSFLGMPLNYKGRVIGNLYLTDKEDGDFTREDEEAIQAFAVQAAIAIENARLYEQVKEVAVLQERERIGMDLHDGTIQAIYGVGLKIEDCINRLETEPAEVSKELDGAIERLNGIIRDIRNYIFDLRPLRLQGADLVTALRELVMDTKVNTLMTVELEVDDERIGEGLSEEQASQLFAIAHEALANVRKHSQAKNVCITLQKGSDALRLTVADDGRGMDLEGREHPTGRGLGNMAERAEVLQGRFELESSPGAGTAIVIEMPLRGEPLPETARA